MTLYRIIDKETKLFLRDDFVWNAETEQAISTECPHGMNKPKWVEHEIAIDEQENELMHDGKLGEWVEAL